MTDITITEGEFLALLAQAMRSVGLDHTLDQGMVAKSLGLPQTSAVLVVISKGMTTGPADYYEHVCLAASLKKAWETRNGPLSLIAIR